MVTGLKVFMLDFVALTRANCTIQASFWTSFDVTVFGCTAASAAVALGIVLHARFTARRLPKSAAIAKPLAMFWLF